MAETDRDRLYQEYAGLATGLARQFCVEGNLPPAWFERLEALAHHALQAAADSYPTASAQPFLVWASARVVRALRAAMGRGTRATG